MGANNYRLTKGDDCLKGDLGLLRLFSVSRFGELWSGLDLYLRALRVGSNRA